MTSAETNHSLILRLPSHSDVAAWTEFARIYEPMLYQFARKRGLQDADSRDLVQRVMIGVANSVARWQPDSTKGKFRTWLFRIARNQWITMISKHCIDRASGRTSDLILVQKQTAPETESEQALEEYRREMFRIVAAKVREVTTPRTWEAFWRTAILDEEAIAVADDLSMSLGAVYIARSRVTNRLRETIQFWDQNDEM